MTPGIFPSDQTAVQPELTSGETLLWTGRPSPRVIFHREDFLLIPFSLMWGGFAIFWESMAIGFGPFGRSPVPGGVGVIFMLWGIPFVLIGQYLIWGRFVYAAWLKKRTYYAVTNRRVIAVQRGWRHRLQSAYLDTLPTLIKEGGSCGTLRFSPVILARGWPLVRSNSDGMPVFMDVDNVDAVYRLVSELREKVRRSERMDAV